MKLLRIILLFLVISAINQNHAISQSSGFNLDSLKSDIVKINGVFDSSYYMKFKVQYLYSSTNTDNGKQDFQQKTGTYLVSNRNFYFDLGDFEYLQGDGFAITAIHRNKILNFTKSTMPTASSSIQLKPWVDQMINSYQQYYNFSVAGSNDASNGLVYGRVNRVNTSNGSDSTLTYADSTYTSNLDSLDYVSDLQTVLFTAKDSTEIGDTVKLPYQTFSISYLKSTHRLQQMQFNYQELEDEMIEKIVTRAGITMPPIEQASDTTYFPDSSSMSTKLKYIQHTTSLMNKKMTVVFSDYKYADINPHFFRKERYVFYDRMKRRYQPNGRYRGYMLNVSGFEETGYNEEGNPEIEGDINKPNR